MSRFLAQVRRASLCSLRGSGTKKEIIWGDSPCRSNPYPFIIPFLKPEKGTPFKSNLPI